MTKLFFILAFVAVLLDIAEIVFVRRAYDAPGRDSTKDASYVSDAINGILWGLTGMMSAYAHCPEAAVFFSVPALVMTAFACRDIAGETIKKDNMFKQIGGYFKL